MRVPWGWEGEVFRTGFGAWQILSRKSTHLGVKPFGSQSSPISYYLFDLGISLRFLSLDVNIYLPGQL